MIVTSVRGWLSLDLPADWRPLGPGRWLAGGGGILEIEEVLRARGPLEADEILQAHETWCQSRRLHSHETRLETLPSGVSVVRSYGETASDEFLLVAHAWWRRNLVRVSLRADLERLDDADLGETLALVLELNPLPESWT